MPRAAYGAIDLGAESGRAIVGVLDDDALTLHEVHRFENAGHYVLEDEGEAIAPLVRDFLLRHPVGAG